MLSKGGVHEETIPKFPSQKRNEAIADKAY